MNAFGKTLDLIGFLSELPEMARRADTERLSVMLPTFKRNYPDLWADIQYCAQMESPALVIAYLAERYTRLAFLKSIPNVEPTIQFLMNFVREREEDAITDSGADEPWTTGRYRERSTVRPARRTKART